MQTIGIVLNVGADQAEEFENGLPRAGGADLGRPPRPRAAGHGHADEARHHDRRRRRRGAVPRRVAIFATDEGHHAHDDDPRFEAWNKRADTFQIAAPYVFGGDTIVNVGP